MSKLEAFLALHIRAAKLPEPQREYRFHKTRKWRFDFAWPEHRIAAECEGGTWSGGRHTRGQGFLDDCTKYNTAASLGWYVFRFTREHIESGEALKVLEQALPQMDYFRAMGDR